MSSKPSPLMYRSKRVHSRHSSLIKKPETEQYCEQLQTEASIDNASIVESTLNSDISSFLHLDKGNTRIKLDNLLEKEVNMHSDLLSKFNLNENEIKLYKQLYRKLAYASNF